MGERRSASLLAVTMAMVLQAAAVLGGGERSGGGALLDPRRLEKFVDELPDMPRLRGYGVTDGGELVAGNLTIGMYDTTWVSDTSTLSRCAEETGSIYSTSYHFLLFLRRTYMHNFILQIRSLFGMFYTAFETRSSNLVRRQKSVLRIRELRALNNSQRRSVHLRKVSAFVDFVQTFCKCGSSMCKKKGS